MKIKLDFVTNSSSSSFIMCLPKKPKEEDFLKLNPLANKEWLSGFEETYSPSQIAKIFLKNIQGNSSSMTKEELRSRLFDHSKYSNIFNQPKYKEPNDILRKLQQKIAKNHFNTYFNFDYPEEEELLKELCPEHFAKFEELFNKWFDRQLHKNIISIELENHDLEGTEFGKDSDIIVISNH
jgi:hypothetical protein